MPRLREDAVEFRP